MMPSAASAPHVGVRIGQHFVRAEEQQQACGGQRRGRSHRDDAPRRRQRRLERHDDEPDRRERADAAGVGGDRRDQSGQRQRRKHVRAFVLAGARQVIGGQDRRHQPGEHDHFEHARHAAHRDVDRERRQRDHAADQARRDEGAMARRRQRIVLRRRMHQCVQIVADRFEQAHVSLCTPKRGTRSLYSEADRVRGPLTSAWSHKRPRFPGMGHGERSVSAPPQEPSEFRIGAWNTRIYRAFAASMTP